MEEIGPIKNTCGVYKIKNKKNGNVYIGASSNIRNRMHTHRCNYRKNKSKVPKLYGEFEEYQIDDFTFEVLFYCGSGKLDYFERRSIREIKPELNDMFVNEKLEWCSSEEHKKKISDNLPDVSGKNNPMYGKKHPKRGENHERAKLTKQEVKKIKELLEGTISQREISEKYNVSQQLISRINNGRIWKDV